MQSPDLESLAPSFQPQNFLVLVVDDLRQNLKIVGTMLDEAGYGTTFSTSGPQALERVKAARPDLIVLDLMMPDMSGLDVCRTLKASPEFREIPIIFLTASHRQDHLLKAFELGAVDYVTKPFSSAELLARVRTHLELKHTRDQLQRVLSEVQRMATIDSLTGVLNRRCLFDIANREFERSQRYGSVFTLLMLDVDHFKRINDTYGHRVGDEVLKELTQAIQRSLRQVDQFGRYGGEEFVIVLPEIPLHLARQVGDRLRMLSSQLSVPTKNDPISLTVSIGIAAYDPQDKAVEDIFERADRALYQAKAEGRDRCCVWGEFDGSNTPVSAM
ncbi:MAG: diguanylate cyclase [Leptolyngbya sp. DLM2.Bin15]|nr:MAG: diguanylate cyclase [Leptolyngbya sp. DLM2.Bin15]